MTTRHLCIGINQYDISPLRGCVNDALDWHQLLTARNSSGMTLLDAAATRESIIGGIADLLTYTGFRDTAIVTYSGHGTWVPDVDNDEADGRDEAWVPYDWRSGFVLDDLLYSIVRRLRTFGAKVLIISDSCHSGTVERWFDTNDAPPLARARYLPPALHDRGTKYLAAARKVESRAVNEVTRTGAALLSGCRDNEVAWDTEFHVGGTNRLTRPNGAMTRAAIDAMRAESPTNLSKWQERILATIQGAQTPQVQGTYLQRRRTRFV